MSKHDKLLKESKRLCWEDRLLHKNFRVRYAANIDLKSLCDSITNPKDHRIRELGHLFKKTVSDSDAIIQDKALDALIAYLKAADADVAGRYAKEVCDAIMANCHIGRPKTKEKAQMVFILWVELEAFDACLDAMEKAIKCKDARVAVLATDFMIQALSEFGPAIVPLDPIVKMLLEILDHQDQNVLASSKGLTLELCRWVGIIPIQSVLYKKMSDTLKKELDVELPTVKMVFRAPRKIRSAPKVCGFLGLFPSKESVAETPLGKDVDPVEISTPLKKSGFWNKVKSKRWTQRKDALAKLSELASTKRIDPGDLTDLCPTLNKLITDQSIFIRVEAVRAIGNLALELSLSFSRCSLILLPVLLAKFSEKNPIMTEALTNTLEAIHKAGCVTLANILTDVKAAVKSEDPHVGSQTLNWVMYCIKSSSKAVVLNVHKDYIRICLECLNGGATSVRDAAFSVLAAIEKSVDMGPLNMSLDDVRGNKFSEIIGVSRVATPTLARHGIMKRVLRRGRITEANMARGMKAGQNKLVKPSSEMTNLKKNVAWKRPLEETDQHPLKKEIDQLQKLSLSDPRQQNKMDENGYNQFQKSYPPRWFADDYFDRLSPEELMAEILPNQKWAKANTCTQCGVLGDCRCKRRARLQDTENPYRFEEMYEGFTFYAPPHP